LLVLRSEPRSRGVTVLVPASLEPIPLRQFGLAELDAVVGGRLEAVRPEPLVVAGEQLREVRDETTARLRLEVAGLPQELGNGAIVTPCKDWS
jgi:hypothetical protein